MTHWQASTRPTPVWAHLEIPGSKSETARALYLAAVASQETTIHGALHSRDTDLFAEALRTLGAEISGSGTQVLHVRPILLPEATRPGRVSAGLPEGDLDQGDSPVLAPHSEQDEDVSRAPRPSDPQDSTQDPSSSADSFRRIDCGLAGTVMRFLPPLTALFPTPTLFDGDPEAYVRPLAPLLETLTDMGAHINYLGEHGHLPFVVSGPLSPASPLRVDASSSSQFLTALLLVAPLLDTQVNTSESALDDTASGGSITVEATGNLVSLPHIEMSTLALRDSGISCTRTGDARWEVSYGRPRGGTLSIAPDLSNAGVFLAAAMVCGGRVEIPHWPQRTTQPGGQWPQLLTQMGATVSFQGDTLICEGSGAGNYDGITCDMSAIGELAPTLTAITLFARSASSLTGIAHLRGHETDRLAALSAEIRRLGGDVDELPDGLTIRPRPLHAADLRAYADHRMATFGAIVGLRVPGVTVDDITCTSKTLPNFVSLWEQLLAGKEGSHGA